MPTPITAENTTETKKIGSFSKMIGSSRRLTLTYIVFSIWVALAIFAIVMDADLYSLAVYFASGLPLILGYLWSETSRPSIKDAAEIVKGIGQRPGNYPGYNSFGGNSSFTAVSSSFSSGGGFGVGFGGTSAGFNPNNDFGRYEGDTIINIYSDDATIELKVNETQLSTLKNLGYVDNIGDKFTFKKDLSEQIKSLLNNEQEPII